MKRITTTVDTATYGLIEDLAHRDGVATAQLVREAMERYVAERERDLKPLPLPGWVGWLQGDGQPFAERAEQILAEIADDALRGGDADETKPRPDR
ncbi:MAG: hypothetical protein HYX57_06200 [Chloroflexi bacterium]|nr:hypothetical protein [Chloroflexota bacterium]